MNKLMKTMFLCSVVAISACAKSPQQDTIDQIKNDGVRVNAKEKTAISPDFQNSVTTLHIKRPIVSDLEKNQMNPLPNTLVGPFAAASMPIVDLMDEVSFASGIAFSFNDTNESSIKDKVISLIDPNKITFEKAVKQISKSANVFYSFNDNVLNFEAHRAFHITVPQVAGAAESLSEALTSVGATDISNNAATGGLIFKADPKTLSRVQSLAETWGNNRTMIVYDGYIYEVTLNQSDQSGISLENINASIGNVNATLTGGSQPISETGGLALTLAGVSGKVAFDAIASSIQNAGDYKILSQPSISVASGSSSSLDIGEKQQYVSGLSSDTNEFTSTANVDVDTIETGLTLEVKGQYSDDMIVTEVNLKLATLLGFEEFDTGDNTLRLPNTAERNVKQTFFARPGDVLVIAGVMTNEIDNTDNRSKIIPVLGSRNDSSRKTELIIVMRPRVIQFQNVYK